MDKIPPIYVLNLERFPDNWERTKKNLIDVGIPDNKIKKYKGFDGLKRLPYGHKVYMAETVEKRDKYMQKMYKKLIEKNIYGSELKLRPGEIGHYISFYKMFKKALRKNYNHLMILEDDIYFPDPKNFLNELYIYLKNVPKDWDILYFGMTRNYFTFGKGKLEKINEYVSKPSGSNRDDIYKGLINGNHASIFNRRAMEFFVNNMMPMKFPTDVYFGKICSSQQLKCYSPHKSLIKPYSDISTTGTYKLEGTSFIKTPKK